VCGKFSDAVAMQFYYRRIKCEGHLREF
jgi:hypothetical protein